ncbi:hypothetical protein Scel_38940 [Streptomyces cellostaticus]|nr:hypothetical protein Scel_38940 [Streptomyces cellostaticus]
MATAVRPATIPELVPATCATSASCHMSYFVQTVAVSHDLPWTAVREPRAP